MSGYSPEGQLRAFTAFAGQSRLASGPLPDVAAAAARALADACGPSPVLVFDDTTGRAVDLDLRGSEADVRARAADRAGTLRRALRSDGGTVVAPPPSGKRRRGRPRLGVIGKEVTLLPRHWAWLDAQAGGASATLRRLIDEARRASGSQAKVRDARDAAYRFMAAMCGDLPGYEEALRALFQGRPDAFLDEIRHWPPDVKSHAASLAAPSFPGGSSASDSLPASASGPGPASLTDPLPHASDPSSSDVPNSRESE